MYIGWLNWNFDWQSVLNALFKMILALCVEV